MTWQRGCLYGTGTRRGNKQRRRGWHRLAEEDRAADEPVVEGGAPDGKRREGVGWAPERARKHKVVERPPRVLLPARPARARPGRVTCAASAHARPAPRRRTARAAAWAHFAAERRASHAASEAAAPASAAIVAFTLVRRPVQRPPAIIARGGGPSRATRQAPPARVPANAAATAT